MTGGKGYLHQVIRFQSTERGVVIMGVYHNECVYTLF